MASQDLSLVPKSNPWRVLTDQKRATIIKYLLKQQSYDTACGMARVRTDTFQKALDLGRKELEDYEIYDCPMTPRAQFAQDVARAIAQADVEFYDKLLKGMEKDPGKGWVGVFTYLERTRPEKYGRKSTVTVNQDTSVKVTFQRRSGMDWQMGNVDAQRQLVSGDVVDTELVPESVIDTLG